ncbi:LysE family translocator [Chelativorans composti]|jgi:Putative threonine efflux protein|uniref:LysE family translocator n=1 Tax=Chelativorans composti TaxID=768533 RepID=A0ABW5DDW5_9HYPH
MSFVPDFSTIVQFAIATFIITITPGPDMTLFLGRALSQGKWAGIACMSGAMTGIVIHTTLVAVGLSALLVASPTAFWTLKIGGAGYLVWLAIQAVRHGSAFNPDSSQTAPASFAKNWATGLGINLLNPKIILFFMTFLPQFVTPGDPNAPGQLFFLGMMFIVEALPFTVAMILVADSLASLLRRSQVVTRVVDYLFAGVFSAFAVKILTTQAR